MWSTQCTTISLSICACVHIVGVQGSVRYSGNNFMFALAIHWPSWKFCCSYCCSCYCCYCYSCCCCCSLHSLWGPTRSAAINCNYLAWPAAAPNEVMHWVGEASVLGAELSTIAKLLNAHYHAPHLPYRLEEGRQLRHANPLVHVMNVSTQRVSPFAFRMQIEFNHTQELFPLVVLQPNAVSSSSSSCSCCSCCCCYCCCPCFPH